VGFILGNRNGFSAIEGIIATAMAAIAFSAFNHSISLQAKITNNLIDKSIAELSAAELTESLRTLSSSEMQVYLSNVLEVSPPCQQIPGDFTRDGEVNNQDHQKWAADKHICGGSQSRRDERANPSPVLCASDANGDGIVDQEDEAIFHANKGKRSTCGSPTCTALLGDLNLDGAITTADLNLLNEALGRTGFSPFDLNRDQQVDVHDANIIRHSLNRLSACGRPTEDRRHSNPKSYLLCETINPEMRDATSGPIFYDPIAELPAGYPLKDAHRSYSVQIANMRTLEVTKCDQPAATTEPSPDEFYLVKTVVTYGNGEKMTIASAIPRNLASEDD
jgi:hypothetical protein